MDTTATTADPTATSQPAPEAGSGAAAANGAPAASGADSGAAAPPPAKPETPQESAVMRSLRRQEADFIQKQQAWRAQQQAEQYAFSQRVDAAVQAEVAKRLAEFDADPIAFAKKRGLNEQTLAGRLVNDGRKPPEEAAREALERAAKLEKQLAERDQSTAAARARENFEALLTRGGADKYPHAFDEWSSQEMIRETYAMLAEVKAKFDAQGQPMPNFPDDEIAEALDLRAKARQAAREERKKGRSAQATKDAPQGGTKADGNGTAATKDGKAETTATTTLTGRMSSDRASVSEPDYLAMSEEEQRAYLEKEIAKARAASTGKA